MDYQKLNEEIKKIFNSSKTPVDRQGGFEVFDLGLENGYFLKVEYEEDSYGGEERIVGFQFVKKTEKKVVTYIYE